MADAARKSAGGGQDTGIRDLLPVLVHVQTHLDGDLSLDRLAEKAAMSRFAFHRRFREAIGETPKAYATRLRLERAAYELRMRDATVLEIALGVGFGSHEVFTRAFRRRFGMAPSEWRRRARERAARWLEMRTQEARSQEARSQEIRSRRREANRQATRYTLSATHVHALHEMHLAFVRNLGPYPEVDPASFDRVVEWALERNLIDAEPIRIGMGHDDPTITPPDRVRFDACVRVPGPIRTDRRVGYQVLPAGHWAVTTYVGPFGASLEEAYGTVFARSARLRGYALVGLPAVEVYGSTDLGNEHALHHTDIMLPLRRIPV